MTQSMNKHLNNRSIISKLKFEFFLLIANVILNILIIGTLIFLAIKFNPQFKLTESNIINNLVIFSALIIVFKIQIKILNKHSKSLLAKSRKILNEIKAEKGSEN